MNQLFTTSFIAPNAFHHDENSHYQLLSALLLLEGDFFLSEEIINMINKTLILFTFENEVFVVWLVYKHLVGPPSPDTKNVIIDVITEADWS